MKRRSSTSSSVKLEVVPKRRSSERRVSALALAVSKRRHQRSEERVEDLVGWCQRRGGALPLVGARSAEERSLAAVLNVLQMQHIRRRLSEGRLGRLRQIPAISARLDRAVERAAPPLPPDIG